MAPVRTTDARAHEVPAHTGEEAPPAAGASAPAERLRIQRRHWLQWALGTYGTLTLLLLGRSLVLTGGELWYSDDGFIHLAMARNLAEHGMWGVTAESFQSASSAPLWTLALAAVAAVAGRAVVVAPLLFNVLCGIWILWRLADLRDRLPLPRWATGRVGACAVVVVAFLPGLTLIGMEHMLQVAVCLELVSVLLAVLEGTAGRWGTAWLALWSMFCVATRFEGAFLVAGVGIALLWAQRQDRRSAIWNAAAVVAAGLLPILVMAVAGLANGGFALPNSILAKSAGIGVGLYGRFSIGPKRLVLNSVCDPLLAVTTALLTWRLFVRRSRLSSPLAGFGLAVAVAAWAQLVAGICLPAPRYQSWIVLLAVLAYVATSESAPSTRPVQPWRAGLSRCVGAAVVVAFSVSVVLRAGYIVSMPHMLSVTHDQQGEVGRFVAGYVPSDAVLVLSDIGAPTWLRDGPIVDLFALGSSDVLRAQLEGRFDREWVTTLFEERRPPVAAVNVDLMESVLPHDWARVAIWTRESQLVPSGSNKVGFYAPRERAEDLRAQLADYEDRLPPLVSVSYDP